MIGYLPLYLLEARLINSYLQLLEESADAFFGAGIRVLGDTNPCGDVFGTCFYVRFQARQMREAVRMRNRGEGIWERIRFVSSGEERTF